jgi:serine/threonine protein phosphatase PrpC
MVLISADDSYKSTDSDFLESDSTQNQCGSTASTAVLVGNRLFVANVGDSRAIICRGGNGNQRLKLNYNCTPYITFFGAFALYFLKFDSV